MADKVKNEKTVELPLSITVRDLAETLASNPIDIIKVLMQNGVMANINQLVDFDTAAIVAAEMGIEATLETIDQAGDAAGEIPLWKRLIAEEDEKDLAPRAPVVTILGHVDHGKTSLLDAIRATDVQSGEAGGITQHIGAYQVQHEGKTISFLDTPGHAAFTAMRARGAQGADVVILVVAADDGVMPQTKEALNHARAAQVPLIVALNKIDRPNANPEFVKQQLSEIGLIPDDWDGDTMVIPVSATEKQGLDDLLEAVVLVADSIDILANPAGQVFGTIVEGERNRNRGVVSTLLVQNGTLKKGDIVVAGTAWGKVKAMFDYRGEPLTEAGPSTPVEVMGLNEVPAAGDLFRLVGHEREARAIVAERLDKAKDAIEATRRAVTLESMFDRVMAGELRELRLVIKADVQGSLEPVISSLQGLNVSDDSGDISVNVLHSGTGNISEHDIMLAAASQAIVMGFNVSADVAARKMANRDKISIRDYNIIYRLIEDVEKALKGMLEPEEVETIIGKAEVREIFKIRKIGNIAGCRVVDGEIRRNAFIRVMRADKKIFDGEISSLKHEKENVNEVRNGFECGISVKDFAEVKAGDILECYIKEFVAVV